MKKTKKMGIGVVAAFLIIAFPLLSVGSAKEKEVLIAGIASMTGPVAEHIVCGILAMEDAFAFFNKNGGVDGVKIKFEYHDNRFKVPDSVSI
ncbi:MAG: ABC transporter substrate-binding protein, partial [Thermodesulfobacteriota bacterium]|nr:ABC transporter substrate-binding protein [Thermodesulfobacteriota bacterium]